MDASRFKSLSEALDLITVAKVGDTYAEDEPFTQAMGDWWEVLDGDIGAVAYLPTERAALRFRLDYINRFLNP